MIAPGFLGGLPARGVTPLKLHWDLTTEQVDLSPNYGAKSPEM